MTPACDESPVGAVQREQVVAQFAPAWQDALHHDAGAGRTARNLVEDRGHVRDDAALRDAHREVVDTDEQVQQSRCGHDGGPDATQDLGRGLTCDAVVADLHVRQPLMPRTPLGEAVAEQDDVACGQRLISCAGAAWARRLYVLYVYAADPGTAGGPARPEAVVDPQESMSLWVADPRLVHSALHRKHGFVADGAAPVESGCGAEPSSAVSRTANHNDRPLAMAHNRPDLGVVRTHHARLHGPRVSVAADARSLPR